MEQILRQDSFIQGALMDLNVWNASQTILSIHSRKFASIQQSTKLQEGQRPSLPQLSIP